MHIKKQLLILLMVAFISACKEEPTKPTAPLVRPVKLFEVKNQNQETMRSFPAEVEANQGSYLAFRVNGELTNLPIRAGEAVKKGQLLAKLDPTDFLLQVDDKKARYELAVSQLDRTASLLAKGIASQSEYDQTKANKQVAESALRKAQTDYEYSQLKAPFSGTIAKVFVKNYENIQAKQNILRLETRDLMDVTIQVPEKVVARVDKTQDYHPKVVFDGFPNQAYDLTIKEWDTQADPNTLTYRVVFSLPVPDDFNLLAGMTGNVYIDLAKITKGQHAYFLVPVESVFSEVNPQTKKVENAIWRFDPITNAVQKVIVQTAELHRNGIEVTGGLNLGDFIVSAGVHSLSENQTVRPWQREKGL